MHVCMSQPLCCSCMSSCWLRILSSKPVRLLPHTVQATNLLSNIEVQHTVMSQKVCGQKEVAVAQNTCDVT